MSSKEIFEITDTEVEETVSKPKPVKEKKAKKPMSDERKAQLREQLARGRETALKNRQKKALGKKIDREEAEKKLDEKIAKKVLQKDTKDEEIENLKAELKSLKENGNSSEKIEKMSKNMFLMGKVVDHLVEENNAYKKRKEDKKKKKEELENMKKEEEVFKQKAEEAKKKAEENKPKPVVFNSREYRQKLKGYL